MAATDLETVILGNGYFAVVFWVMLLFVMARYALSYARAKRLANAERRTAFNKGGILVLVAAVAILVPSGILSYRDFTAVTIRPGSVELHYPRPKAPVMLRLDEIEKTEIVRSKGRSSSAMSLKISAHGKIYPSAHVRDGPDLSKLERIAEHCRPQ